MMQPTPTSPITPALVAEAMTYAQYMTHAYGRFEQHLTTADDPHYNTEQILGFTRLNFSRIARLEKTTVLTDEVTAALAQVREPWIWLVLVESWCGDVAQILPVMKHMADWSGKIELRLLLRDKNLPVIDAYRTNGGRSIPKLVCLRQTDLTELGTWGPRPAALQAEMDGWKTENTPFDQVIERAHGWYAKDRTAHTQAELAERILTWSQTA
ncbi:thioredoxin family protein [Fibrella aquatilis]|uniref:Thioredoxin family protein n=1 Tax=Fibrella aquatilis TaxID=2817059 RepID=A0A939G5B1_9BACT|nr:thioredoxin family protein [Fibrella aquatilis]MBO0932652.1 thioredoxin family protein [Fibrella aquatilis]